LPVSWGRAGRAQRPYSAKLLAEVLVYGIFAVSIDLLGYGGFLR
jgi:hypothetical protein